VDGAVHTVSGADVRSAVGLRDTWFRVVREAAAPPGPR
jgi:hypothetical protein